MSKVGQNGLKSPFFSKEHLTYLFLEFEGRINRQAYWFGILAFWGVCIVIQLLLPEWLSGLITLALIYPGVMLGIKRCHDRDRSGHFMWLGLIPLLNLWPFIELGFLPGTSGPNTYGTDPLGE